MPPPVHPYGIWRQHLLAGVRPEPNAVGTVQTTGVPAAQASNVPAEAPGAPARTIVEAEDRLLELTENLPPGESARDFVTNPETGRPYTPVERERALANARGRELAALNVVDLEAWAAEAGLDSESTRLIETGNYDNHLLRGLDLDLSAVEAGADPFNDGGDTSVVLQSVFDPVVADRPTTIDEYSLEVTLPDGVTPEEVLAALTRDMDGVIGGAFAERGDFRNLATYEDENQSAAPGQVIDIDVRDLYTGFLAPDSPFNAPVVVTASESDRFVVQTIELDTKEHLLHGTREWGFETLPDGEVRFYTRGISVEDIGLAQAPGIFGARFGERQFWSAWVDGIGEHVETLGGDIVEGSRVIDQSTGPSGNELWSALDEEQREAVRTSQISGLGREIERLDGERQALIDEPGHPSLFALVDTHALLRRADELRAEQEDWRTR